jgi:hypothetical protein
VVLTNEISRGYFGKPVIPWVLDLLKEDNLVVEVAPVYPPEPGGDAVRIPYLRWLRRYLLDQQAEEKKPEYSGIFERWPGPKTNRVPDPPPRVEPNRPNPPGPQDGLYEIERAEPELGPDLRPPRPVRHRGRHVPPTPSVPLEIMICLLRGHTPAALKVRDLSSSTPASHDASESTSAKQGVDVDDSV